MSHSKQMWAPPGKPLFFSTLIHDNAGPSGVHIDTDTTFTHSHLQQYLPLSHNLSTEIQTKIINAHNNLHTTHNTTKTAQLQPPHQTYHNNQDQNHNPYLHKPNQHTPN